MNNILKLSFLYIKWLAVLFFIFTARYAASQDIGILSSSSPNSGCELANNELVTVIIFNFGGSYSGSFDVSYKINGNTPVTETITLSPFPATSSFSYTFTTPADLSTANTYNFNFYTNLIGDINNSNDTLNNISIVSDTLSYGGILNTSQSLCISGNSGSLTLNSHIGNILFWESSTNGGSSWNNIANTTSSENYLNLTQETWYRAIVENGFCPQVEKTVKVTTS